MLFRSPYSPRSPQWDPDHEPDELGRGPVRSRRMIASPLGDEPPDPGPIRKSRSWKNLRAARRASHRQAGLRRCRNPLPTQGRTAAPPSHAMPSAGEMRKSSTARRATGRGAGEVHSFLARMGSGIRRPGEAQPNRWPQLGEGELFTPPAPSPSPASARQGACAAELSSPRRGEESRSADLHPWGEMPDRAEGGQRLCPTGQRGANLPSATSASGSACRG